ncbi:MAG: hypothetical protein J6C63_03335 [Lachnospiraceae bacterium]|nr:hypothetical protein [Lachnospiraceae bacterium]
MGWLKNLFTRNRDDDFLMEDELWDEDYYYSSERSDSNEDTDEFYLSETEKQMGSEDSEWDWNTIVSDRTYLNINDAYQREKYIRSLVEQVKDASTQLDKLSYEYNVVTAVLKDMDELEALPSSEKNRITEIAKKILHYQKEKQEYQNKKSRLTDSQFYRMEQYEDSAPRIYEDMHKAEKYREMIKDDLSRLEGEKHAFQYRKSELKHGMNDSRGMAIICMLAMALLLCMLAVMQFGFEMKTGIGYVITIVAGAIALAVIYARFIDQTKELKRVEKGMNRIILLQNTVKIRYVNNVNLLDYLYLKYSVKSAREWKTLCDVYEEEKRARTINEMNEEELDYQQSELLKILRNYQLSDARLWLRSPLALYDHREMVEIRHEHIVRRQKLRAQMDYNRRMAKEGEKELRAFIAEYPQHSKEAIAMMDRYS